MLQDYRYSFGDYKRQSTKRDAKGDLYFDSNESVVKKQNLKKGIYI